MKKLGLIALLLFYLGSVSGMHIHVHYCCAKVKYISFFDGEEKKSCCGTKKKSKGCCHDKTAHLKIAGQHESAYGVKTPGPASTYTDLVNQIPASKIPTQGLSIAKVFPIHKPPVRSNIPLYLSNNVFRI